MSPLPVLTSPLLDLPGVRHAFFTRQGGVSGGIYESLNVGRGSSDDADDVAENRRRCAGHFGLPHEALSTCYQIHSATALVAERLRKMLEKLDVPLGGGKVLQVTASFGTATMDAKFQPPSPAELLKAADECVYAAKRNGRNRVVNHQG